MSQTPDQNSTTIAWKRDYLQLDETIEAFIERRLKSTEGNVAKLLAHHLTRSRVLLWAEVNGGLEDTYAEEAAKLQEQP